MCTLAPLGGPGNRVPTDTAALVLVDRCLDLVGPASHGDHLLDRVFGCLPRRQASSSTPSRPPKASRAAWQYGPSPFFRSSLLSRFLLCLAFCVLRYCDTGSYCSLHCSTVLVALLPSFFHFSVLPLFLLCLAFCVLRHSAVRLLLLSSSQLPKREESYCRARATYLCICPAKISRRKEGRGKKGGEEGQGRKGKQGGERERDGGESGGRPVKRRKDSNARGCLVRRFSVGIRL